MDEKALSELLECSVCLDRLDHTSKVLPCQHTFCRRCLDEIILTKRELRCPECRFVVETKVEDLPNNILLIRLLEGIKTSGVVNKTDTTKTVSDVQSSSSATAPPTQRQTPRQGKQACAKAIYDYEAKENGDLGLKKGDIVTLRKQLDENWYQGELNGQYGFFPTSYVQVLVPLPQVPQCRALYDFDLKDENEKDCLVFKKDDVLTIIRRVDENWLEGRKGDKIGIFPVTFVELNDTAKSLVNTKSSSSILQTGIKLPSSSGSSVHQTLSSSHLSSSLPQQKRHSFTLTSNSPSPSPPNPQRHSCELMSTGGTLNILAPPPSTSSTAVASTSITSTSSMISSEPENASPRVTALAAQNISTTNSLTTPVYISLYNYKSQKSDELELKKGENYTVYEKCQDGWFKGTCIKTGQSGVFPGNYVQMIRPSSAFKPINPNVMTVKGAEPGGSQGVPIEVPPPIPSTSNRKPLSPPTVPPPLMPRSHKSSSGTNMSPPSVSVRSSSASSKPAPSYGTPGSSLVAIHHSLSASSNLTPPNKVAGASKEPIPPLPKEKKEKKDKSSKGLAKLLTKTKKSKSTSSVTALQGETTGHSGAITVCSASSSSSVVHARSGSHPSNSSSAPATTSSVTMTTGDSHKKSSSFDSTSASKPVRPKPLPREKYSCIVPYPPQTDHELDLQIGDIVYVHKKREDGWFKGTLHRNGKTGLFPGSFVEKME